LLDHLAFSLQWQCAVDLVEPRSIGLPLFDQDLESDADVLKSLTKLHQRFTACSGIIVACPEYNGQATPLLKNTIDWVSRLAHIDTRFDNPFLNKPVLLCSASTGWGGGALVIQNLRSLFGYLGAVVMGPSIGIARSHDQWTVDGFEFDGATDCQIEDALSALLQWSTQHRQMAQTDSLPV
jgi:NAD(P)H-dependent FMN reductase